MRPGRFFWKLFIGNVILMALVIGAAAWLAIGAVESAYQEDHTRFLETQAYTVRHRAHELVREHRLDELRSFVRFLGDLPEANLRVTVVALDGGVLADSSLQPERWTAHGDRPEIVAALREGIGVAQRYSDTLHTEMRYVALRLGEVDAPLGTVRISMPVPSIMARTQRLNQLICGSAALVLAAAVILAMGLAFLWSNPIRKITETARSLSRGELSARMDVSGRDEIGVMAAALNQMRGSLAHQLRTIEQQRHNLEYLIRVLTEGVIVADAQGRIVLINQAASRLIGCDAQHIGIDAETAEAPTLIDRQVKECILHPALRDMLIPRDAGCRAATDEGAVRAVQEVPIQLRLSTGVVHLLARGTDIDLFTNREDRAAGACGRLVVLTDITELTETIRMKTDFVANASHELRTPLATIRASVETLQQMELTKDEAAARSFIHVVDRHTSRLEELVNDLLDLSRLEASAAHFPAAALNLPEFLDGLRTRFSARLIERRLEWRVECGCDEVVINGRLLQLVLDNLVSNSIKFSDPGGQVTIECHPDVGATRFVVIDRGCGIPAEDQSRVFERFYQVQRARSGAGRRGAGLGLAIVRHAVAAMGGTVHLQSEYGKGTAIAVTIPQPA